MLHPSVLRELYGDRRKSRSGKSDNYVRQVQSPRRHVTAALLVMTILSCWALDLLQVRVVPRPVHETVASAIDSQRNHLPIFDWLPDVDCTVARNPLDDSPINFGSVLMLGAICVAGLLALGFSGQRTQV